MEIKCRDKEWYLESLSSSIIVSRLFRNSSSIPTFNHRKALKLSPTRARPCHSPKSQLSLSIATLKCKSVEGGEGACSSSRHVTGWLSARLLKQRLSFPPCPQHTACYAADITLLSSCSCPQMEWVSFEESVQLSCQMVAKRFSCSDELPISYFHYLPLSI